MAEHDWRDLLDDPEVEIIIGHKSMAIGRRFYNRSYGNDALALDDLESWTWDRAVDIAMTYRPSTHYTDPAENRRAWLSWLYVALRNDILRGMHLRQWAGLPGSAKRQLRDATAYTVEEAVDLFGERMFAGSTRTWASDPLTVLVRIERVHDTLDRLSTRPQDARTPTGCIECGAEIKARNLCSRHYQRARTDWLTPGCAHPDCPRPVKSKHLCAAHYEAERRRRRAA